ncbi:MAG: hydrogenase iron-sulfur subunit [Candidatus Bathyarchaeia archaeon]|jgi:heterodisulfide reductase subunit A
MKGKAISGRATNPRVGVFLCHCGTNIAGVVDVPKVAEFVRTIPNVVYVGENIHTCSSEGLKNIKEAIKEQRLERVIVAACTPRTHEPIFREAVEEAGLNKYLFQMVNIREHDSWVHKDKAAATEKAKYLVQMAVSKAVYLEPEEETEIDVLPSSLVIGAGVSGMTASLSLAEQGFDVVLVEKEKETGGVLRDLHTLFPGVREASELIQTLGDKIKGNDKIQLLTSARVKRVDGFLGNFDVEVEKDGADLSMKVGTIIVATGAEPLTPTGYYLYGETPAVITQYELERRLKSASVTPPQRVVMIQCVGAMEERGRLYCSRICCDIAVKNALKLIDLNPSTEVYMMYRDLMTYGLEGEVTYQEALRRGIRFVKFQQEKPPNVVTTTGGATVSVYEPLLESETVIEAGLVVLSTPLIQREEGKALAKVLRVPLTSDGFFLEAHPKMRPVDFSSDGIFLCGTAHGPKNVSESVSQALAAAARAAIPMSNGKVKTEAVKATLDEEMCVGCGACASACPFDAIEWGATGLPVVNEASCKGCGVCSVECPMGAMQLKYFKDNQLIPAVDGLLSPTRWLDPGKESEPVVICFACRWCSYAAADFAGVMRLNYPVNVRIILVPCSGRVDFKHVFEAFQRGADGVIIAGCLKEQCHYVDGNIIAERRVDAAKKTLNNLGVGGNRLEMFFCSAGMPREFASFMVEFTERIKRMGVLSRQDVPALQVKGVEHQ